MQEASRIKRWRDNKRQQGLKAVTIWLTDEEELRLKDLALQWHCSPSQVMQRALAQVGAMTPAEHSGPPDIVRIRELILAELAALGITMPAAPGKVTVGDTVGPTETKRHENPAATPPAREYEADHGHRILTESAPPRKRGRQRSLVGQQILDLLAAHPEGLSAEQIRGYLTPDKRIGDTLSGMKRLGTLQTRGQGRAVRYFLAHPANASP
jgi:hypothetical protein